MEYNRGELKRSVKCILRQTRPSPLLVTLVFLLVGYFVPTVIEWFTSPADALASYFSSFADILESGDDHLITAYLMNMPEQSFGIGMLISIFLSLFSTVLGFGYLGYCLKMVRHEDASYGDVFSGFAQAGWVILMYILMGVFVFLWTMLFSLVAGIIIGVTAAFLGDIAYGLVVFVGVLVFIALAALEILIVLRYAMAPFILFDHPDIGALEPIRRSKQMMKGQKGRLFVLELSFIGWYLLIGLVVIIVGTIFTVIGSGTAIMDFSSDPMLAVSSLIGSMTVGGVVSYLVSIALSLWIEPYVTGSKAQFYQMVSRPMAQDMNAGYSNYGGQPPYYQPPQYSGQSRPLSDYEPKPQAPSTPGYDPEKNAPVQNPQPEQKPEDELPQ